MKFTKENAYKHLREAIDHFGRFPTIKMYSDWSSKNGKINFNTVMKLTNKKWRELENELRGKRDKRAREDYIIFHLQEASKIYGDSITKREYIEYYRDDKENRPSLNNIENVFSTFNKAKLAAGLVVNEGYRTEIITKEQCIKALREASKELGDSFTEPQYLEWVRKKQKKGIKYPDPSTIRKRFGKFSAGIREADLKTVFDISEQDVYEHALMYLQEQISVKKYDEWAKSNEKLLWENFSKLGYGFRETMIKTLINYLQRR